MNQLPQKTLYLLLVLVAVVALTVFVLWKGFTTPAAQPSEKEAVGTELDFSLLESEKVKRLELIKEIPEFKGEMKRDNPFSSYEVGEVGTTSPEEE